MKLQISFDIIDLNEALKIAHDVAPYADILEVGTMLIYQHGIKAVEQFRTTFEDKTIIADAKIVDRGREAVKMFAQAGADWVTVMAGTNRQVIQSACATGNDINVNVMLDLLDADSPGQSALEAKNLGADALLFHEPYEEKESLEFLDKWDMVKGNASLPVFISAKINRESVEKIIKLKPNGIIVDRSITLAENPAEEAKYFYDLCKKN